MLKLYGIRNCDTVRAARTWLEARHIDYDYHDLREDGVGREQVQEWLAAHGWQGLVNTRSTPWRALPTQEREAMDDRRALDALLAHPTLFRRPLLELGTELRSGFKADSWEQLLETHRL